MSNLKVFGITLKDAKAISKKALGRMPKPGREVFIAIKTVNGYTNEVWMQNRSGSLELRAYNVSAAKVYGTER
jgi:hypothetical protein